MKLIEMEKALNLYFCKNFPSSNEFVWDLNSSLNRFNLLGAMKNCSKHISSNFPVRLFVYHKSIPRTHTQPNSVHINHSQSPNLIKYACKSTMYQCTMYITHRRTVHSGINSIQ